jgi:peptide/nickel transport system permease protein
LTGIFSEVLSNDKPIYCRLDGKTYFPVFREFAFQMGLSDFDTLFFSGQAKSYTYEAAIFPLIPYKATESDLKNYFKSPLEEQTTSGRFRHWLGTHDNGQDVAAGLIAGTRSALLVGFLATLIAGILGIFLGSIAGFWGDDRLRVSRIRLWMNLLGLLAIIFYVFISPGLRRFILPDTPFLSGLIILVLILTVCNLPVYILKKIPYFSQKVTIPADLLIMRLIEIKNALPALLLLLVAVAWIEKPSVYYVIAIIGVLESSLIARFMRGELLRVRSLDYIEAARAMGFSDRRILWNHALANAISPVLVFFSFSVAGAIILESAISFMGIGNYATTVTWGSLLSQANVHRWWLALFPGLMIFMTVLAFNTVGEEMGKR